MNDNDTTTQSMAIVDGEKTCHHHAEQISYRLQCAADAMLDGDKELTLDCLLWAIKEAAKLQSKIVDLIHKSL